MASTARNWFSFSSIKNWLLNINPIKTKALPQQEDYLTKTLGKYEPYVFYLQNILIWDDPIISSFSILAVNIVFWIVFNFELKFYGVIFTTLLAWMCYEAWVNHIWPEISVPSEQKPEHVEYSPQQPSGVLSVPEISGYMSQTGKLVKRYCLRLRKLRADQPGMFCCELGSVCAGLAMLGRAISGPCIFYVLLMSAMTVPGVWIHILPPHVKESIAGTVTYIRQTSYTGAVDLDDMIPESTHENLQLFHMASELESSDRDDSTEFTFDPDSTDDAMSLRSPRDVDDIAELESRLAASLRASRGSSADSDEIRFRSSHFDGSSSDDEDAFARGLEFADAAAAAQQTQTQAANSAVAAATLLGNLGSLLATVMARPPPPPPVPRRESSSDLDDFEIIDPSPEDLS